jgi:lipoprotein-releasing system permease protein
LSTSSFTWLVALRYLRRQLPLSNRVHIVTVTLLGCFALTFAASYALDHIETPWAAELRFQAATALRAITMIVGAAVALIVLFIVLIQRLTIFTTISTYGLFLGSGAMVIALSVMSGFESDLRHKILGTNAHVVLTTPEHAFTDYEAARARADNVPGVVGVTPYITSEVMIASQSNLAGVILKGIDPATIGRVTDLKRNLDVGELEYLSDPEKLRRVGAEPLKKAPDDHDHPAPLVLPASRKALPGVIVGRELAKNLRVYVGDDVNLISPLGGIGPSGPIPKSKPFRVAGIFFSGMFEYDSKYIYVSIPAAQKFLGEEDEVTGLEMKVANPERTETALRGLRAQFGDGFEVRDWKDLNKSLFSALKLEKIAMFIVLCFIILVAAFSIIANGIMLVVEKGREIAILKSMGASDRAVLVIFMILGLYMGLLGTASGIASGIAVCQLLSRVGLSLDPDVYYITQLPVRLNPYEILAVLGAAVGIALLATMYPAWLAARLKPVEGLREGNH